MLFVDMLSDKIEHLLRTLNDNIMKYMMLTRLPNMFIHQAVHTTLNELTSLCGKHRTSKPKFVYKRCRKDLIGKIQRRT